MPDARFQTTQWSMVLRARDLPPDSGRHALAALCEAYWYPLYSYVRRQGSDADEAADLIQGYFARFLERGYIHDVHQRAGRFRSFLLASLKHFISNERARTRALKRGGGFETISLDTRAAERHYAIEPVDALTPEMVYERRWALTVVERALDRLREWAISAGKLEQFEAFEPLLTGQGPQRSIQRIAQQLEMSEGSVRVAIHRLRHTYGECLREEIADTVAGPSELDDEVRHVLILLGDSQGAGR